MCKMMYLISTCVRMHAGKWQMAWALHFWWIELEQFKQSQRREREKNWLFEIIAYEGHDSYSVFHRFRQDKLA
jgi:hypothetical protein